MLLFCDATISFSFCSTVHTLYYDFLSSNKLNLHDCTAKKKVPSTSEFYLLLNSRSQWSGRVCDIIDSNEKWDRWQKFCFLLKNDAACSGASEREPDN